MPKHQPPPYNTSWVWQQLPDKFCIQCCSANEFQAFGISGIFQVRINHTGTWGGFWFLTMPFIRYGISSNKTIYIHIYICLLSIYKPTCAIAMYLQLISGMRLSIRVGYFTIRWGVHFMWKGEVGTWIGRTQLPQVFPPLSGETSDIGHPFGFSRSPEGYLFEYWISLKLWCWKEIQVQARKLR